MRREERVTVQGPVMEQQPDGMSHRGGGAEFCLALDCVMFVISLILFDLGDVCPVFVVYAFRSR